MKNLFLFINSNFKKIMEPNDVASSPAREKELNEKAKMSLFEKILCYMW